jgi:hypothetical protein
MNYLQSRLQERSTQLSLIVLLGTIAQAIYPSQSIIIQSIVAFVSSLVAVTPG